MSPGGQITSTRPQVYCLLLVLQQHQYTAQVAGLVAMDPAEPVEKPQCQQHSTEDQPQEAQALHRQQPHDRCGHCCHPPAAKSQKGLGAVPTHRTCQLHFLSARQAHASTFQTTHQIPMALPKQQASWTAPVGSNSSFTTDVLPYRHRLPKPKRLPMLLTLEEAGQVFKLHTRLRKAIMSEPLPHSVT